MDIFYEIFNDLPRGGPGGDEYTRQAYEMMTELPNNPSILDIGCGKGIQTLELARLSGGHLTGLDNHQPFLDELSENASDLGFGDRIETYLGSMFSLDFESESFDALWSEGAIYIMGFEAGLREWRRLVKPGGYIAVSELCWFKSEPEPPNELDAFWQQEYPGIKSIDENLMIIDNLGYKVVGHFNLPDQVWWESLYDPMEKKLRAMENKYQDDPKAMEIIRIQYQEIEFFKKYSDWYGYTFYVMQK
jgi:ubiquinone/menaquinone biosynthesis C-methylase UbiE